MQSKYAMPLLTSELLDQIIFAMENQERTSCLDLKEGLVISKELKENSEEGRYLDLPLWTSADGFRLMEKFVLRVRNPYYKGLLSRTLQSGHGVFRRFKDILSEQNSLLQEWFGFKEHEMEKVVTAWYRQRKGSVSFSGEEHEGEDDEGLGDLLLEDFSVEFSDVPDGGEVLFSLLRGDGLEASMEIALRNLGELKERRYVFAKSATGDVCGMMVYGKEGDAANLVFYGVDPQWRGMGLFRLMFDSFSRQMARERVASITVDFGSDQHLLSMFGAMPVSDVFRRVRIPVSSYVQTVKNSEEVFV